MNTLVRAPRLTAESVLALVKAAGRSGTTLPLLAEDLDVPATSITLRLTVAGLVDDGLIRWASVKGRNVLAVKR